MGKEGLSPSREVTARVLRPLDRAPATLPAVQLLPALVQTERRTDLIFLI